MKKLWLALLVALASSDACAQPVPFTHIVFLVQENRTPDNLFHDLCPASGCGPYDIQTSGWKTKTGTMNPCPVPLANIYDLGHTHASFTTEYDSGQMDGWGSETCTGTCNPLTAAYCYTPNTAGILNPYFDLVRQYGWGNYFFQTNQGPSYPAHHFLFGATSAPSQSDDQIGTFAAENPVGGNGCTALDTAFVALIDANGVEGSNAYPCLEHATLSDLADAQGLSWRYYASGSNFLGVPSIWNAPVSIGHICESTGPGGHCAGKEYGANVDLNPPDVLTDIGLCRLAGISWVTPTGLNSDHANENNGGGPSWVASIVNAIGSSSCVDPNGKTYWQNTVIFVTWDDWGGWYDHVTPTMLPYPQGAYQYGFRVPIIVISAYTPHGFVSNTPGDFGSLIRFAEQNMGLPEGILNFADARATSDMLEYFPLSHARPFAKIGAPHGPTYFLHQHDKEPPDTD